MPSRNRARRAASLRATVDRLGSGWVPRLAAGGRERRRLRGLDDGRPFRVPDLVRAAPAAAAGPCGPRHVGCALAPWSEMIVQILATDRRVFVPSGSALYAYPTACGPVHEPCRPTMGRAPRGWINTPRSTETRSTSPRSDGLRLSVFPQSCPACARRCTPAWTVDVPDGGGNPTSPTGCSMWGRAAEPARSTPRAVLAGGSCAPLWQMHRRRCRFDERLPDGRRGGSTPGPMTAGCTPSASAGTAHFPGERSAPGSQRGQSALYGVVYGLLALAVIVWVVRRRRRRDAAPSPQT